MCLIQEMSSKESYLFQYTTSHETTVLQQRVSKKPEIYVLIEAKHIFHNKRQKKTIARKSVRVKLLG